MQTVQQHSDMWDFHSYLFWCDSVNSAFQFSPRQTFCLRQTNRQSVFNEGISDYQSQSFFAVGKASTFQENTFLEIKNKRQEKDFGQKLLIYKIQHDGYASLFYSAQLKFTIWKGQVGNMSK